VPVESSAALHCGTPGALDTRFGTEGTTTTDWPGLNALPESIALQTDGRILVAGTASDGAQVSDFAVARYRRDGKLDARFGAAGMALIEFPGGGARANAIALHQHGSSIVAGSFSTGDGTSRIALIRLRADGTLDPTFADNGRLLDDFGGSVNHANAIVTQRDGSIIVVGQVSAPGAYAGYYCALSRYHRNGRLDTNFGTDGRTVTDFGGDFNQGCNAVSLQNDGKIVVAGFNKTKQFTMTFALARYERNGTLDQTFGTGGKVLADIGGSSSADALSIQPNGSIVVAGTVSNLGSGAAIQFAVARFNRYGAFDTSFGNGGKVFTDFDGTNAVAALVDVRHSGKILVVGKWSGSGAEGLALARYTEQGALDVSFGVDGKILSAPDMSESVLQAAALDPFGNIVVSGAVVSPSGVADFGLARYFATCGSAR
jgi:uncharacterized delta-60 repeat protein